MLTPSMLPSARYRLEKCVSSLNVFPLKAWRIRLVESFLNPSACGETASAGAHGYEKRERARLHCECAPVFCTLLFVVASFASLPHHPKTLSRAPHSRRKKGSRQPAASARHRGSDDMQGLTLRMLWDGGWGAARRVLCK